MPDSPNSAEETDFANQMITPENSLTSADDLPDYLKAQAGEDTGRDGLKEFIRFPYLQIVQGLTDPALRDRVGGPGVVVSHIDKQKVLDKGQPVHVVPLDMWRVYSKQYSLDANVENFLIESTMDPKSELAKKCRDRNLQQEYDKDGLAVEYVESLNFALYFPFRHKECPALTNDIAIISLSKGEHRSGRNFGGLIESRPEGVKMWTCVFCMKTGPHQSREVKNRRWEGWDFTNPPDPKNAYLSSKEEADKCEAYRKVIREAREKLQLDTSGQYSSQEDLDKSAAEAGVGVSEDGSAEI